MPTRQNDLTVHAVLFPRADCKGRGRGQHRRLAADLADDAGHVRSSTVETTRSH